MEAVFQGCIVRAFQAADKDNTGTLSYDEIRKSLQEEGYDPDKIFPEQKFNECDKDNNGQLTLTEFRNAMASSVNFDVHIKAIIKKELKKDFNMYDEDNSGEIERDELGKLLKFLQCEDSVDDVMKQVDKDKSNSISVNEFVEYAIAKGKK